MRQIEWPKGSGNIATYSDADLAFVRRLIAQAERGEITKAQMHAQVTNYHDGLIFGTWRDPEPESAAVSPASDSAFRVPPKALAQLSLDDAKPRDLSRLPDFDGATYVRALDHARLGKQLLRVGHLMADGKWRTLAEIATATGDPEASVSARLRDLRKGKFGGHTVERERLDGGLFRYRVVLVTRARPWGDDDEADADEAQRAASA